MKSWLQVREPVNAYTHMIAALLALLAFWSMQAQVWGDGLRMIAVGVFCLSTILTFASSSLFHGAYVSPAVYQWLHRIDHATIYLMIAGTYTPFCLLGEGGPWRWTLLAVVWVLAVLGMAYKLRYLEKPGLFSLIYYIVAASPGLWQPSESLRLVPEPAQSYLLVGILFFLVGTVVFGIEKPNPWPWLGYHEIWHLLVMAGSAMHFIAVGYLL